MLKNIASNWLVLATNILMSYLMLPLTLHYLGREQYGVWLLIAAVTQYLTILQLGIPMTSVRFLAASIGRKDYADANRIIAGCAGLYLAIGVAVWLIGTVLLLSFQNLFQIPPQLAGASKTAFLLVLFNMSYWFFGQLPYGILTAHNDFVTRNLLLIALLILRNGIMIGLLIYTHSLVALAAAQTICMLLEAVAIWIIIARKYPDLRLRWGAFRFATVREILGFSVFILILNVGTQLSFQTDSIVIGHFMDIANVPLFAVPGSLTLYLMQLIFGIGDVLMPAASKAAATATKDELRDLLFRYAKLASSVTVGAFIVLWIFGARFIGAWVGPDFEVPSGNILQILMIGNLLFLPVRAAVVPMLVGMGIPKFPTVTYLAAGVLNLGLSVWWVQHYGLAGVAWGTTVPIALVALAILLFAAQRIGFSLWSYSREVLGRIVIGAVPVAAVAWLIRTQIDARTMPMVLASMAITMAVFAALWIGFVYRHDPELYRGLERIGLRGLLPVNKKAGAA